MNNKEMIIEVPEGFKYVKSIEGNKAYIRFEKIEKPVRWRDNENVDITGCYIDIDSTISDYICALNTPRNYNVFSTKKQAKSALAMARISQIMANDERFGGVVTDEEWKRIDIPKYCIKRNNNVIQTSTNFNCYYFLAFHTEEQRDLFLKENEDLVKDYFMI